MDAPDANDVTIDGEEFTPTHTNANLDGKLSVHDSVYIPGEASRNNWDVDPDTDGPGSGASPVERPAHAVASHGEVTQNSVQAGEAGGKSSK